MTRTKYFILSGVSIVIALAAFFCATYAGQMQPEPCWRAQLYDRECVQAEPEYIAFWSTVLVGSVCTIFAAVAAAIFGVVWGASTSEKPR